MKVLSVMQPWASLLIAGIKHFETRGWKTEHKGKIGIHASRKFTKLIGEMCHVDPFKKLLDLMGFKHPNDLPKGCILGTVEIAGYQRTEEAEISEEEKALGDYRPGRFAWRIERPEPFKEPIYCGGRLGIWEWRELQEASV